MRNDPRKQKKLAQHLVKATAEQRRVENRRMKIAKICLEGEPAEAASMLLGISHHVIQTIPRREIRERLILDAIRAFAGSIGPYSRR